MTQPTIVLSPRKSAISAQGGAIEVLVRVQAPDQLADAKTKVAPKRLALVWAHATPPFAALTVGTR